MMSYLGLLINTVTIRRPTVTYTKGRASKTYTTTIDTDVKCRIQWVTKEEINPRTQGYELVGEWNAFFENEVNLRRDDQLTDESSRVFIAQSAPIDVTGKRHHVECKLELVA